MDTDRFKQILEDEIDESSLQYVIETLAVICSENADNYLDDEEVKFWEKAEEKLSAISLEGSHRLNRRPRFSKTGALICGLFVLITWLFTDSYQELSSEVVAEQYDRKLALCETIKEIEQEFIR